MGSMPKKRIDDGLEASKKPAPKKRSAASAPAGKAAAPKSAKPRVRRAAPKLPEPQIEMKSDGREEPMAVGVADAPLEIVAPPAFVPSVAAEQKIRVPASVTFYAMAAAMAFFSIIGGLLVHDVYAAYQGPTGAPPTGNIPITIWNSEAANPVGSTQANASIDVSGKVIAGTSLRVDKADANPGTLLNNGASSALYFGASASGEGIASRRTAGTNQWGLDLYTNQLARLSISNSGNVAIGTTSLLSKLQVASSDNANATIKATSVDYIGVYANGGTNTGVLGTGGTIGVLGTNNSASGKGVYAQQATASGYALYASGGINYFSGNVGIGDVAPATPLSVGAGKFQVDANGSIVKLNNVTLTSWPAANASGVLTNNGSGALTWGTPGLGGSGTINTIPKFTATSALGNSAISDNGTTVTISSSLQQSPSATGGDFSTLTGAGTQTSYIRGKKVNLSGMTAPAAGLGMMGMEVALPTHSTTSGGISVIGYNIDAISNPITNSTAGSIDYRGYSAGMPNVTGSSVTASGYQVATRNVTTGTVNGVYVWPLSGYSVASGTLNGVKIANVPTPGAGAENAINIGTGWDTDIMFNDASSKLQMADGGTMTIADSVGSTLLTLADGGASGTLTVGNFKMTASPTNGFYLKTDASGNASWSALPAGVTGSGTVGKLPKFTGASALGDSVITENGGNIGIGTTTIPTKLTVAGGSTTLAQIGGDGGCGGSYSAITIGLTVAPDGTCKNYTFLKGPGDPSLYINRAAGDTIRFRENNVDQIAITPSGSLELDWGNTNSGSVLTGLRFGYASGEGIGSKRTATGNQYGLDFYTNSANRMAITNGGNVGIGT
ncbi:MAG: hypothetical protein AAB692_00115, partial [Patescibacteria group bacterium]